jgi:hypothetical protein
MTTPELLEQLKLTEQRIANACNQLLIKRMSEIRHDETSEPWMLEDQADRELIHFTQKVMQHRLSVARRKGRYGWWNQHSCDTSVLTGLLQRAMDDDDLVSVINYAAMLHVRKIIDAQ